MIHSTGIHGIKTKELEYLTGWQRARADLANLQKRLIDNHSQQKEQVTREVTQELLTLSDNFQVMTAHVPDALADNAWTTGVLHIGRQLTTLLEEFGVTEIKAQGEKFDPSLHEAVEQVAKTEVSSGIVVDVVQPGYKLGASVIRPARVRVAK